jgi:CRISPR system Cascade subunit CasE
LQWLTDRVESWGFGLPENEFGLPDIRIVERHRSTFKKPADGGRRVTLQMATFEGRLQVRDVEEAKKRLLTGVGPARAYGCGLITLAPLRAGALTRG